MGAIFILVSDLKKGQVGISRLGHLKKVSGMILFLILALITICQEAVM